ncbi:hypothetical protein BH11MYX4_BH11MYX4_56860 [soil metagenome]
MKLVRLMSGACAAFAVASLLGCSSSSSLAAKSAQKPAALDERVATTELMSAQLAGPAPKVGKTHRVADDESGESDELGAPKDGRPSDGSHRSGHFGTRK